MAKKARDVFEFLKEIGAMPETLEEELFERAVAAVGAELLAYRKQHNLTQEQLAKRLKISQEMVSRIEVGSENLSLKRLAKIAAALGGNLKVSLGILPEDSVLENYPYQDEFFKHQNEFPKPDALYNITNEVTAA
ncbi:MAG: XRE family transcriptional regulator [Chloroflexi bacterium]|nr:MAG: XRE family transcriptional regulator [Chloroflexota bacterium]